MSPKAAAQHDARHRVLGYLVASGVTDRRQREHWIARLLDEAQREGEAIFNSPQATVRAIDGFNRLRSEQANPADSDAPRPAPWLPEPRFTPMPRQPLGDLPAVLRGSFWSRTARWAWPRRLRAEASSAKPDVSQVN